MSRFHVVLLASGLLCPGVVRAQCSDGTPPPCHPAHGAVTLGRARVTVLSVSPPPGSAIKPESLAAGLHVKVVLEHVVERRPRGVAPYLVLMARASVDPETWFPIAERVASRERMQLALEATLTPKFALDGTVLLGTVVWFKDSTTKTIWAQPGGGTLIEYTVDRGRP